MFEQSLYNQEAFAPVPESHEGDLFHDYEFKNWNLTPRIYKIVGASALINLLFLVFVGQTDLLTRKGCDSPITSTVCQVIDMAVVADTVFGTKRDYVDEVYEKTSLKDADVTFVDVSDAEPQLQYPEGYFALANPEQTAMLAGQTDPGGAYATPATPDAGHDLVNSTPNIPKADPNSVVGPLPSSPLGDIDNGSVASANRKRRGGQRLPGIPGNSNDNVPGVGQNTNSNSAPNSNTNSNTSAGVTTDPVNPGDINKRPFKVLGNHVNDLRAKNEISLDTPFIVNAKGKIAKDGKLDPKSFTWVKAASTDTNQKMIEVVKEGIEAISDSGYLTYLKDLSGKNLDLLIQQDDQKLSAVIQSEMESDTRARSISSALNLLISVKKNQKDRPDADQNDKDDLLLLNGATVKTDGKKVIITFDVPKAIVQQMILRKLDELAKEPKTESGTSPNSNENTAINK